MNLDLEIRVMEDYQSGISRTGKPWASRNVVFAHKERPIPGSQETNFHENLFHVHLFGPALDQFMALNPVQGGWINADVVFSTKMFGQTVGNEVDLWNIKLINLTNQNTQQN